jgi:hypothetical protein
MSQAQQIIGKIRDLLDTADQSQTPEFMDAATAYLELCRSTNERLRRCAQLLRQNLRTEAIHIAEADPNLLDQVAILDFPERQAWREMCVAQGMTPPPALDIDASAELNEAYAQVQPLETLLARHRQLALSLAPVHERLTIMRQLAELDPGSLFWEQDIKQFEDARLDELRQEINQPGLEEITAERLKREIDTVPWRINFPADLKKTSDLLVSRLRSQKALRDLELLMPDLDAAYAAMDEGQCEKLSAQCRTLLPDAAGAAPEHMRQRLAAVESWLKNKNQMSQEQKQFFQACSELEKVMDDDAPTPEVQRAYTVATKFTAELPPELDERYQKFISWRQEQIVQRRKMILMISSGALAVVVLITGVAVYLHLRNSTINAWVQQLSVAQDDVNNNGNDASAQEELVNLAKASSAIQNDPRVQALAISLKQALSDDAQRAANFKKALGAAEALGFNATDQSELNQALQLARTASEQQQVHAFSSQVGLYQQQQQLIRDNAFNQAAATLEQKIQSLLSSDLITQNPQAASQALVDLKNAVTTLAAQSGVSSDVKDAQIPSLDALVKETADKLGAQESDQLDYQQIFQPPSAVSDYVVAVNTYLKDNPNGVYAPQVKLLSATLTADSAIEAWSDMTANWPGTFLTPDMAQAQDRVSAIDQYVTQYQGTPLINTIQAYRAYLAGCVSAATDDGPWKRTLAQILNKPLLHDLQYLKTNDGKIYYVMPGSQVNQSSIGNNQEISFDAITTSDVTQPSLIGMSGADLVSTTPQESPETQFSHQALDEIDSMQLNQYTIGLDLLDMAHKSSMDPVVKGILISDIITLNNSLLPSDVNDQFNTTMSLLQPLGLANINWLDPANPTPQTTIDAINDALTRLPDISQIESSLSQEENQMAATLQFQVQGTAVLNKTPQGIVLITKAAPSEGLGVYVVLPSADQSQLTKLGSYTGGAWTFDQLLVGQVQSGTLVFLMGGSSAN